jgi:hypothetical protein
VPDSNEADTITRKHMRFLRGSLAVVALAGLGAGCAGSGGADKEPPSDLIVLSKAIGGVKLGERRDAVENALGEDGSVDAQPMPVGPPLVRVSYASAEITAAFAGKGPRGTVIGVLTDSPRFHTAGGLGVGSSVSKVRTLPGAQCSASGSGCQLGFNSGPGTIFALQHGRVARVEISLRATG